MAPFGADKRMRRRWLGTGACARIDKGASPLVPSCTYAIFQPALINIPSLQLYFSLIYGI